MSTALVWFRYDLRLHDNEVLTNALKHHDQIIPFYCFDKKDYQETSFGFKKTGSFRAQFLIESIQNLKENLQNLNSDLVIRFGETAQEILKLCGEVKVDAIYSHKQIHSEETEIQNRVEKGFKGDFHYYFDSTLYHINDLPHSFKDTPKVFTSFRKGVESKSLVREPFPLPDSLPELPKVDSGKVPALEELGLKEKEIDRRVELTIKGGEKQALKRLNYYLFEGKEISSYKEKRNRLIGADYSSKLSLWLWNGCVSPRKVYWEVKRYEEEIEKNQSTYWLIFELMWRDYFKFISLKHGDDIFKLNGIKKKNYKWEENREKLEKWTKGETGIPFIDANMKELNSTGFMSNRGRQNVASFLVKELGLDWRMGAEYFESKLIDYDVASNYGNWMYIAGVGNDPRDRYFNIISQAKRYDENGEYVKLWLPELKDLRKNIVHHPWTKEVDLFNESTIDYPEPMTEPGYWKKHY